MAQELIAEFKRVIQRLHEEERVKTAGGRDKVAKKGGTDAQQQLAFIDTACQETAHLRLRDAFEGNWMPTESCSFPKFGSPYDVSEMLRIGKQRWAVMMAASPSSTPSVASSSPSEAKKSKHVDPASPQAAQKEEIHARSLPEPCSPITEQAAAEAIARNISYLDSLLWRFLLTRSFDFESAALRFLRFRKFVLDYSLDFDLNDTILAALKLGVYHVLPAYYTPESQQPIICVMPRNYNWTKVVPKEMTKAWFFLAMMLMHLSSKAQTEGIVIVNSMKGMSSSASSMEFNQFLGAAQSCLPVKISAGYVLNQPFIFGTVLWPLAKRTILSTKLQSRITVLGDQYAKPIAHCGKSAVPVEAGGDRQPPDTADFIEKQLDAYREVCVAARSVGILPRKYQSNLVATRKRTKLVRVRRGGAASSPAKVSSSPSSATMMAKSDSEDSIGSAGRRGGFDDLSDGEEWKEVTDDEEEETRPDDDAPSSPSGLVSVPQKPHAPEAEAKRIVDDDDEAQ